MQNIWTDIWELHQFRRKSGSGIQLKSLRPFLRASSNASSNEGDIVLDPFCGCGTAIAVAQRLNRQWIGIDITHLAIGLIKSRLRDAFGE